MIDFEKTIISQFANSPTIVGLVANMNAYVDQSANFQAFYDFVWNVDTAQGFGLDIWGKIVDIRRELQINPSLLNFGFSDGLDDYAPFGQAPFYNGAADTNTYILADNAYRVLILAKALANISATSAPSLNQLLQNLFPGRGRCYANDLGNMAMRYTFEFYLEPFEIAIVTSSGVLPHCSGVSVSVLQVDIPNAFGFEGSGLQPFGQGSMYVPL